jgi:hypothetical protein
MKNPMKKLCSVVVASLLCASCGTQAPESVEDAGPSPMPYGNLAQMMRVIPFPNSNLIYDAGGEDPEEAKKALEASGGATARYGSIYAGWQQVENAALALSETANLLMIPGRLCENGKPVPNDAADFKEFTAMLASAGQAAYTAAQTKDLDQMLAVGETVTEACSACHEVYRDKDDNADRCTTPAAE